MLLKLKLRRLRLDIRTSRLLELRMKRLLLHLLGRRRMGSRTLLFLIIHARRLPLLLLRLMSRLLRLLIIMRVCRIWRHPLWMRVNGLFGVAVVRRRRRRSAIIVQQLLRRDVTGLVLRRRYVLRILTGTRWWKAHFPDTRWSTLDAEFVCKSNAQTRKMRRLVAGDTWDGGTRGGQLIRMIRDSPFPCRATDLVRRYLDAILLLLWLLLLIKSYIENIKVNYIEARMHANHGIDLYRFPRK